MNSRQKLLHILKAKGVSDFSSFDETFVDYFLSSLFDESIADEDLIDMLKAICPTMSIPDDDTHEFIEEVRMQLSYVSDASTKSLLSVASNNGDHEAFQGQVIANEVVDKLVEFEINMISSQFKSMLQKANIAHFSSFDPTIMLDLMESIQQAPNQSFSFSLLIQYFPPLEGNEILLGNLVKLLNSAKIVKQSQVAKMVSNTNAESDYLETETSGPAMSRKFKAALAKQYGQKEVLERYDKNGKEINRPVLMFVRQGGGDQKVRFVLPPVHACLWFNCRDLL
jgi:hypothetical protein